MNQAVNLNDIQTVEPVATGDRLSFTLFIAAALHATLLLGVNFTLPAPDQSSQTIEITLSTHHTAKAPDDADFLAEHNQEASGTLDDAKQLTTTQSADFADLQVREVSPLTQEQAAQKPQEHAQTVVTTTANSFHSVWVDATTQDEDVQEERQGLLENQPIFENEIASLQAKLDKQRQEYARRPRMRTLTSVSTKATYDAKYLHAWASKIEQIGSDHYPPEALVRGITGKMRLSVILNPDGSIVQINVLQSSGQRVLDDAARQIVRLASPFAPFPPEISQHTDRLEIIRTWNFDITGQQALVNTSNL